MNESLYVSQACVIQYDRKRKNILYIRSSDKHYKLIDLKADLKCIQLDEHSGNLIATSVQGQRRIFLAKSQTFLSIKVSTDYTLQLVNQDYLIGVGESIIRLWRIQGLKLHELHPCDRFIKSEFLAPSNFHAQTGQKGEKLLVMSNATIQVPVKGMLLIEYIPLKKPSKDKTPKEPAPKPEVPRLIAMNLEGNLQISYDKTSSCIEIYRISGEAKHLLGIEDKHSCGILQVDFVNNKDFVSLDSGGKFKIWRVDDDSAHVCQTIKPGEFPHGRIYNEFSYDIDKRQLTLTAGTKQDVYRLNMDKFKRNAKNELLEFFETREHVFSSQAGKTAVTIRSSEEQSKASENRRSPDPQPEIDSFVIGDEIKAQVSLNSVEASQTKPAASEPLPASQNTQQSAARFRRTGAKIYVGIDFGTSRTKVSFNNEAESRYEPLNFKFLHPQGFTPASSFDDFVIPSIACISGKRIDYGFPALTCQGDVIQNFKQHLMQADLSCHDKAICAGFLAYVMQAAIDSIKKLVKTSEEDEYIFSVCLPVEQLNNGREAQRFGDVLRLARRCLHSRIFHDLEAMYGVIKGKNEVIDPGDLIKTRIIPESTAEILDFCERGAKSKLYALYDFGAGTTDLTVFYVNRQTGKTDIVEAKIIYQGYSHIDHLKTQGEVSDDTIRHYYQDIWKQFHKSGVWKRAKDKFQGPEHMKYFYEISLFGSGGGFNDPVVKDIFARIPLFHENTKKHIRAKDGIIKLAEPVDWSPDLPPYFRYAVSFGLTKKPEETLTRYILPRDCPTHGAIIDIRVSSEPDELIPTQDWLGR